MKRNSTFKTPTYTESLRKKVEAQKRAISRQKERDKQSITNPRKTAKKGKNGVRKRKRKSDLAKLKEQLWKLCREIQITRYGRTCYCCGAKDLQGSNCHLGHFIPSSVCSTEIRYSLDNLRPCCYHCNINLSGNWIAYEVNLIKENGADFVTNLKNENNKNKGEMYRKNWYENKIEEYTELLRSLEAD